MFSWISRSLSRCHTHNFHVFGKEGYRTCRITDSPWPVKWSELCFDLWIKSSCNFLRLFARRSFSLAQIQNDTTYTHANLTIICGAHIIGVCVCGVRLLLSIHAFMLCAAVWLLTNDGAAVAMHVLKPLFPRALPPARLPARHRSLNTPHWHSIRNE